MVCTNTCDQLFLMSGNITEYVGPQCEHKVERFSIKRLQTSLFLSLFRL